MIVTTVAAICLLCAAWLWCHAFNYTVDAGPIGSMMLAASVGLAVASVFLFGLQIGTML